MFYYPIKSHYSQTYRDRIVQNDGVLLPYKITLLSNLVGEVVHGRFSFTTL